MVALKSDLVHACAFILSEDRGHHSFYTGLQSLYLSLIVLDSATDRNVAPWVYTCSEPAELVGGKQE